MKNKLRSSFEEGWSGIMYQIVFQYIIACKGYYHASDHFCWI